MLDLDTIVWEPAQLAVQRPATAIRAALDDFLAGHDRWVIEGCYGSSWRPRHPPARSCCFSTPGATPASRMT
jgi:hypothetical protein